VKNGRQVICRPVLLSAVTALTFDVTPRLGWLPGVRRLRFLPRACLPGLRCRRARGGTPARGWPRWAAAGAENLWSLPQRRAPKA